ncbi:hypothetical protein [Devosia sp. Root105]|uniref:hypothetical protein n=1 Tax=Devosia sp. Root105 TaxID=1736423 RepID=UPI0006FB1477|nr:hypothetical protein [Devosia sp. Root105]KQU93352.1 hypothetical protein ASC68_22590 [Devosia sp. Root105]
MTTYALVSVGCPHCSGQFLENAKLVRPDGDAWCPHCEKLFTLDSGNLATRRTLAEAKAARRRRKDRLTELRATWSDVPAAPPKPMLMGDVLRALDELLDRLDGLTHKRS